jgi:hypothetical protein
VMVIALLIIVYNSGGAMRCCALLSMLNSGLEGGRVGLYMFAAFGEFGV